MQKSVKIFIVFFVVSVHLMSFCHIANAQNVITDSNVESTEENISIGNPKSNCR